MLMFSSSPGIMNGGEGEGLNPAPYTSRQTEPYTCDEEVKLVDVLILGGEGKTATERR